MTWTESALVSACLNKDPAAQRELYDRYCAKMMSVCLRYMGSTQAAEDVLQEGFLKVYTKLEQYKGKNQLAGWIKTIMVNTSLIHLRQQQKHRLNDDIEEHYELGDPQWSVMEQMGANEVLELVAQMPDGYRTVFNLFAVEGFPHKEIAEPLGVTESTSKTQFRQPKSWLIEPINENAARTKRPYEPNKP